MSEIADRVAYRFKDAVSKEDVNESTKAKKTIHEWASELSDFAIDLEKFSNKVDGWRDKLPEAAIQAKYYERVDDDLIAATGVLNKTVEKLRKIAHDLGGQ